MRVLITGGNGNLAKLIDCELSVKSELFDITRASRAEIDMLDLTSIKQYLSNCKPFDILIHTAIVGGRRTKPDDSDIVYQNILMFENLMQVSHRFKLIINLDSGAIYDRSTDIYNRKETDLLTVPKDFYGFSKYLIYQRSLQTRHIINFRIFNIFHADEADDRFIKACFLAKHNGTKISIFQDKYFDFMYKDDFIKILQHYLLHYNADDSFLPCSVSYLPKTVNISYQQKYKLSDIANMIIKDESMIEIHDPTCKHNYSGDGEELSRIRIELDDIETSLKKYEPLLYFK
jgi:nucleoside-diphosphate-sugar epimerase